jgi:hypothetical protein
VLQNNQLSVQHTILVGVQPSNGYQENKDASRPALEKAMQRCCWSHIQMTRNLKVFALRKQETGLLSSSCMPGTRMCIEMCSVKVCCNCEVESNIFFDSYLADKISSYSISYLAASYLFFSYIFLGFFVYTEYLCRPSEASTRHCAILGSYPPKE